MNPSLQPILDALAAGAVAALAPAAGQAIQDGYAAIKRLIMDTYEVGLRGLERATSADDPLAAVSVQQEALAAQLDGSGIEQDAELMEKLDDLAASLAATDAGKQAAQVVAVDLADIRAQFLNIGNVISSGSGVVVRGADIQGGIEITDVQAGVSRPQSQPEPAQDEEGEDAPLTTILFLAANPSDQTRLDLAEESREIDRRLRMSSQRDRFDLELHFAVQVGDLQELLLRYRPQVVHFSGHGSDDFELLLQDDSGSSHPVSADALRGLFAPFAGDVQCVVLNACYAEGQARAIAEHVPAVVGMNDEIGDLSAREFAASFYQALGYGRPVDEAFELGVNQIALMGYGQEAIPVLVTGNGLTAQDTDDG